MFHQLPHSFLVNVAFSVFAYFFYTNMLLLYCCENFI